MATINASPPRRAPARGEDFEYRPLSTAAVASLVFGLASMLIFPTGRNGLENAMMLTPLPII